MGKKNKKRATQIQENNVGCTWGLIQIFYSRRDPKLILDRKQGSRRHSFSGFAGRVRSRNKSRDFEEIDEEMDNMEECSMTEPTVKRLMQGELGKLKQSKKIPSDEVQRILADLGHDVCLDKNTMQNSKAKGVTNPNGNGDISIASSPGSLYPSSPKYMKQAEEDHFELALSDFLGEVALSDFRGEVYKYHDEGPSDDCMSNSELCPELKSLINTKLDEFSNPLSDLAYKKILVSEEKKLVDNKHLHNRYVGTTLEPRKMIGRTNTIEDTKSSNQHELAIKTQNKESKNIFFWKKDKSSRRQTPERSCQPVNKIVILKPNPKGGFGPTVATASTQAPGYSAAECSTFSVKEVRRRFRIVTGENRKGRHEVQGDPCRLRDSVFTIKKDSRQVPPATAKHDVRRNSSKQKQINDELGGTNSDISTSRDASIFYAEAKKHLTEILKDKSHTDKYPSPTVQISRSLVRMLSLPQCSTSSSPGSSPRVKHCIELSPEDNDICAVHKAEREESANGRTESEEDPGSVECGSSEALDEQANQERHYNKEGTQHGVELDVICTEEIDKPDHSETIRSVQSIPAQQNRYNSPPEMMEGADQSKEHDEMFPGSPENVVEKLEQQDPKTPRPNASTELISQEQNHEKQEQPSPVSVLDPLSHEDADSSDNKRTIKCELPQDVLRPQYYLDTGSDQEIFWEDRDARLGYIKAVLELSELYKDQNSEIWHLQDELISTCLFEELHRGDQTDGVKLFFDRVCEAITVVQGTHFRNPPCLPFVRHNIQAPPMGHNLVSEINKHIEGHLCYQFPSTLNHLVDTDLKDCIWMDLRSESGEIAGDIWEFLVDELMEDAAYDLLI